MNVTAGLRRRTRVIITVLVAAAATLVTVAPAHATDSGGDGFPTSPSCTNVITVKTVPIYGSRGYLAGVQIGELQLRWSWGCYGNWSRVVLWGGMYPNSVTIEQSVSSEGRSAASSDTVVTGPDGTSAWTKYVHLVNSSSTACVSTTVSSNFGTNNFHSNGASFCSH